MDKDREYINSLIAVYKERCKRDISNAMNTIEDFLAYLEFHNLTIVKKV